MTDCEPALSQFIAAVCRSGKSKPRQQKHTHFNVAYEARLVREATRARPHHVFSIELRSNPM